MKGSPRSLWLSMANRVAGQWASAATAELKRQQRAVLSASLKAATGTKAKRKPRSRRPPAG